MKIILDIEDEKAPFILELLKNFKFVKTSALTNSKAEILNAVGEAVEEVRLIRNGTAKGRPARELLDEI